LVAHLRDFQFPGIFLSSQLVEFDFGQNRIAGIRSPQEALAMSGGLNWKLTDQELQTIEEALKFWN
jgi:hypothetical protein